MTDTLALPFDDAVAPVLKAASLWEPWCSLCAIGAKKNETRGWAMGYRGSLALHATKGIPSKWLPDVEHALATPRFQQALRAAGYHGGARPGAAELFAESESKGSQPLAPITLADLPLGCILALVRVEACIRMGPATREMVRVTCGDEEMRYGDFSDGRYAWAFADLVRLPEPVPCKGAQMLWDVPADARRAIRAQLERMIASDLANPSVVPAAHRRALGLPLATQHQGKELTQLTQVTHHPHRGRTHA